MTDETLPDHLGRFIDFAVVIADNVALGHPEVDASQQLAEVLSHRPEVSAVEGSRHRQSS